MQRGLIGWGAALCLLAGTAGAEEVEAELSGLEFDGDKGVLSGDLEVEGQLIGEFDFQVRKATAHDDGLYLTGVLEAHSGKRTQIIGEASFTVSDASGLCDAVAVTPTEVHLDKLGLTLYAEATDADLAADSAHGQAVASAVCAATHLLDDPHGPLAAAAPPMVALLNRSLGYQRDAVAVASGAAGASAAPAPTAARAQTPAAAQTITITPTAPALPALPASATLPELPQARETQPARTPSRSESHSAIAPAPAAPARPVLIDHGDHGASPESLE